ncbi:hypothetical protein IND94_003682 [Salmonella enterica]|nr:hypothetical protein [Salmonella enterica]
MKRFIIAAAAAATLAGCAAGPQVPQTEAGRAQFFTQEKHVISMGHCGWAGDLQVITGPHPAVLMGGSVLAGKEPEYKGGFYSFRFNGGSLLLSYSVDRHNGGIIDRDSLTPCRWAYIHK